MGLVKMQAPQAQADPDISKVHLFPCGELLSLILSPSVKPRALHEGD